MKKKRKKEKENYMTPQCRDVLPDPVHRADVRNWRCKSTGNSICLLLAVNRSPYFNAGPVKSNEKILSLPWKRMGGGGVFVDLSLSEPL
ncbi:hypothetical protein ACLG6S_11425 [Thermodesulfobacteriota bacterium B35]